MLLIAVHWMLHFAIVHLYMCSFSFLQMLLIAVRWMLHVATMHLDMCTPCHVLLCLIVVINMLDTQFAISAIHCIGKDATSSLWLGFYLCTTWTCVIIMQSVYGHHV